MPITTATCGAVSQKKKQQHTTKTNFNNALNVKEAKIIDSKNNLIVLPKGKKIILKGLNNYIIVEKNNTLLIYPKKNDQEIGKL